MKLTQSLVWALGLSLGTLAAGTARANDKEWARVGKVATVVLGLDLLGRALTCPPPPPWHGHHMVQYSYYYAVPPPAVVVYTPMETRVERVIVHERVVEQVVPAEAAGPTDYSTPRSDKAMASRGTAAKPAAKEAAGKETVAKTTTTDDAIIVNLDEGRRLYQPKVKGEKAQLQVWSEIEQRWVPIKDYPSLY